MKVQVRKAFSITWDGTPAQYIAMADDLMRRRVNQGLDSWDLGDATGAILAWADSPATVDQIGGDLGTEHDSCFFTYEGNMLGVSWEWELFEYPDIDSTDPITDPR